MINSINVCPSRTENVERTQGVSHPSEGKRVFRCGKNELNSHGASSITTRKILLPLHGNFL